MIHTLALVFALLGPVAHATAPNRVLVSVDLTHHVATIFNYKPSSSTPLKLSGPTLATVPGSVRPGRYRARLPKISTRAERGASHLDHALLFDGMHSIRSSTHFQEMSAHPIAGSIVLDGEFGGVLYQTVRAAGGVAIIEIHP